MGGSRWDPKDWASYSKMAYDGKTADTIYKSTTIDPDLNPHGVVMRESRDSDVNPESNAIIIALDVTGSMSMVLEAMIKKLNVVVEEIYSRKPVSDPHIMCMGVGDVEVGDRAPLQVTQFEADLRIAKQLEKIWLEQGGGGNSYESYALPWYFAAMHTSIDCFEKRGKKGYLFTVGDEEPTPYLYASHIEKVLGSRPQTDLNGNDILTMVSRTYDVFHIMVEEGSHFRSRGDRVVKAWGNLLGQRALRLEDHRALPEVIVSAIQMNEGESKDSVIASWDGSTSVVVRKALSDYKVDKRRKGDKVKRM